MNILFINNIMMLLFTNILPSLKFEYCRGAFALGRLDLGGSVLCNFFSGGF